MAIQKVSGLEVYNLSFSLAMEIFEATKRFPKVEKYSLTDQIRRSSRSVSANISEGYGKRVYPASFKRHLIDSMGSLEETKTWLEFAKSCQCPDSDISDSLYKTCEDVGAKIFRLHEKWQ